MNKYEINKINCGELGIRTLGTLLAYTHFPGVPLQPLEQLSLASRANFENFNNYSKLNYWFAALFFKCSLFALCIRLQINLFWCETK